MAEYMAGRREPGQVVAVVVGGLFVVAGLLGVGPGLLDNLVHLAFGMAGLAAARAPRSARAFLIAGGVAYFLLWQFGGVIDPALVPFRTDAAAVHLPVVASMIGLAVLSGGRDEPSLAVAPAMAESPEPVRVGSASCAVRRRPIPSRPRGR